MNRKGRRAQGSNTRRAVRGIAKAAGQAEPTADEKDPAFLALQIRSLHETIAQFVKVQQQNTEGIRKAFQMTDVHHQILQRIARDLTIAVSEARRLFVDGDVTSAVGDLGLIKLHPNGTLNMQAYYEEYRKVNDVAGPEDAETALIIWSQGNSPEEAVDRARLERSRRVVTEDPVTDTDYEVEFYRAESGDNVESHHEQVAAGAQEAG